MKNLPVGPLGEDLRDLRESLGLSLRDAAKLLLMSDVALGWIERRVVSFDVFQFADAAHRLLSPYRKKRSAKARRLRLALRWPTK